MTEAFLKSCRFDPNDPHNKYCPIFDLYRIFQFAKVEDEWENAAKYVSTVEQQLIIDCP